MASVLLPTNEEKASAIALEVADATEFATAEAVALPEPPWPARRVCQAQACGSSGNREATSDEHACEGPPA